MKISLPAPFYFKQGPKGVLLLHAYSGTPNDMRMLGRFLEKQQWSVYAPMFSGHGTWEPEAILAENPEVWRQDARAGYEFLRSQGCQQIVVMGLSMGGIFALDLLTEKLPGIVAGGAFCSPVTFSGKNKVAENFLAYSQKVFSLSQVPMEQQQGRLLQIQQQTKNQLKSIQEFAQQVSPKLAEVSEPVFLGQGGSDELIEATSVYETARFLKNAPLTLHWYPKSGHVITVGAGHHQLESDVYAFLQQLA